MRKISVLAIMGVLLAGVCSDGFAASSLNAADAHSPKVQRAASMHFGGTARSASLGRVISPKQIGVKSVHGTATTPMARSASLSRSSVGRYVGASKEQSVSMAALPDSIAALPDRVTDAEGRLDTAEGRLDTAETNITDLQDAVSNLSQTQADWNETDDTSPSYIQNKPEIPAAQVQADWNETDDTSMAYIQNKPEIPTLPTNVSQLNNDANYITAADVPAQVNADWNATEGAAQILNKPEIPTLPTNVSQLNNDANYITAADVPAQVNADWNATEGAAQILNKPEIPTLPTNVSQLNNDANYITAADVPAQVQADWNETDPDNPAYIANKPSAIGVGDLNDLDIMSGYGATLSTNYTTLNNVVDALNILSERIDVLNMYVNP